MIGINIVIVSLFSLLAFSNPVGAQISNTGPGSDNSITDSEECGIDIGNDTDIDIDID